MKVRGKHILLLAAPVVMLFAMGAKCDESDDSVGLLKKSIDSLRVESLYAEALDSAEALLAALADDPESPKHEVSDTKQLIETLRRIISMPVDQQKDLAEADGLTEQYMMLYDEGYADSAGVLAERQLVMRVKLIGEMHPDVASSASSLAYLQEELGNLEAADSLYQMAIAIERATLIHEHPDLATDLTNYGSLLHDQRRFKEAEELLREALLIYRNVEGEDSADVAWVMGILAILLKDKGEFGAAEPMNRRELAIYQYLYGDIDSDVAGALNSLAVLLNAKGLLAEAEPLFYESLDIYNQIFEEPDTDVAVVRNNLASLLQDKGDYAGAERHYKKALEICTAVLDPDDPLIAATLNNLGDLYHDIKDYGKADSLYREALEIRRSASGESHQDVAIFLLNIARNCRDFSDYECARPLYPKADTLFRKLLGDEHPYVAMNLFSYSNYFTAQGKYGSAETQLTKAIPIYEVSRLRLNPGMARATFQKSPYPKLANAYLHQEKHGQAWLAAERDLGRMLADLLFTAGQRSLSSRELAREDSLKYELGDLERSLATYQSEAQKDASKQARERVDRVRYQLLNAEAEWREFQRRMSLKYPVTEGRSFPLERVQKSLSENSAIIGWLDVEEKKNEFTSWAYVVQKSGPVQWAQIKQADSSGDMTPDQRMLMFCWKLTDPAVPRNVYRKAAVKIWHERFAPIEQALKDVTHVIIIPSGAMLGVPAEAIIDDDNNYLSDLYSISYVPSATIHAWLYERTREAGRSGEMKSLLVGDPPFNPDHLKAMMEGEQADTLTRSRGDISDNERTAKSLRRLPATRDEIMAISSMVPNPNILLGPDASEENLHQLTESGSISEYSVIHIATHALVDDAVPERSALVLSQCNLPDQLEAAVDRKRIFDGFVTAGEVVRDWRLDAELVTLSACETGLGKKVGGEGYIGFSNAFLQAGARSLIVSLWKVEDRATSLLMQRFYENYFGGISEKGRRKNRDMMKKADALQEAKKYLRKYADEEGTRPFEHPYFWSAFILIGE